MEYIQLSVTSTSISSVTNSTTDIKAEAIDPSSVEHNSLANPQTSKMLNTHLSNNCILLVAADLLTKFHLSS